MCRASWAQRKRLFSLQRPGAMQLAPPRTHFETRVVFSSFVSSFIRRMLMQNNPPSSEVDQFQRHFSEQFGLLVLAQRL